MKSSYVLHHNECSVLIYSFFSVVCKMPPKHTQDGESIVLSGFRNDDLDDAIKAMGGVTRVKPSSKTTVVVIPKSDYTSAAVVFAKENNIKVMTVDKFCTKYGLKIPDIKKRGKEVAKKPKKSIMENSDSESDASKKKKAPAKKKKVVKDDSDDDAPKKKKAPAKKKKVVEDDSDDDGPKKKKAPAKKKKVVEDDSDDDMSLNDSDGYDTNSERGADDFRPRSDNSWKTRFIGLNDVPIENVKQVKYNGIPLVQVRSQIKVISKKILEDKRNGYKIFDIAPDYMAYLPAEDTFVICAKVRNPKHYDAVDCVAINMTCKNVPSKTGSKASYSFVCADVVGEELKKHTQINVSQELDDYYGDIVHLIVNTKYPFEFHDVDKRGRLVSRD